MRPGLAALWNLTWTTTDWRNLGGALACCAQLRTLSIWEMGMDDAAIANDALQALVTLDLSLNKIGDDGLRHLGDALANGAAPALKTLLLSGNAASDAARQAVEDALKLRS